MQRFGLMLAVVLMMAGAAMAQDAAPQTAAANANAALGDSSSGPQGIIDLAVEKIKETKVGASLGFDGKVGTIHYLAIYTIHDASGRDFMEVLNVGWETRKGEKPAGFLMPFTIDPTFFTHRALATPYAQKHVTASKFPPIFIGAGPDLPISWGDIQTYKLMDRKNWRAQASVRFSNLVP